MLLPATVSAEYQTQNHPPTASLRFPECLCLWRTNRRGQRHSPRSTATGILPAPLSVLRDHRTAGFAEGCHVPSAVIAHRVSHPTAHDFHLELVWPERCPHVVDHVRIQQPLEPLRVVGVVPRLHLIPSAAQRNLVNEV